MNTKDYLTKIYTYLQEHHTYKPLSYNPTSAIANDACTPIEYMDSQHVIDKATMEFLLPPKNICTPLFSGLPKSHKPHYTICPIVSGCDGPTDYLSAYIIHFIQPLASNLPPHIKDRKQFLKLTETLPSLLCNALLVAGDVTSLYTKTPPEDSIAAVIHFIENYRHLLPTNSPLHIVYAILSE